MYDKNNIFAKIIRGEIPCKKVYEDETVLAFYDISPKAKIHVLVIPKAEYMSLADFANAPSDLIKNFFEKVNFVADKLGLKSTGYRVLTNHGKDATQTVFHFHVHILGGEPLSAF